MRTESCQLSTVSNQLTAQDAGTETRASVAALLADVRAVLADQPNDAKRAAGEILAFLWDRPGAWLGAHPDAPVPDDVGRRALAAARSLAAGVPLQYAVRRAAFRNLVLEVDERVLIPRPETEIVVGEALRVCRRGVAVDVGTGSGAVALALAGEGDFSRVIATDISSDALAVAAVNRARLDARRVVELRAGPLLAPLRGERIDLIVSNPPYIAAREMLDLPAAVRDWEPPVALLSGEDGMAHSRALVAQSVQLLVPGGWLVLEADSRRAQPVARQLTATGAFTDIHVRTDLSGRERVVLARRAASLAMGRSV